MPTCYGFLDLHANNGRTAVNAECVKQALRAAGAVIMGKTVTTEFAVFAPGKTHTNPHNRLHTPRWLLRADRRPPSRTFRFHFALEHPRPRVPSFVRRAFAASSDLQATSYAWFPLDGVKVLSLTLDTLGTFTRTFEDAAVIASVLAGIPYQHPASIAIRAPRIGLFRAPWWNEAGNETRTAIEAAAEALARAGASINEVTIPGFEDLRDAHLKIMYREIADSLRYEYENHRASLSARLQGDHRRTPAARLSVSEVQGSIRIARRGRHQISEIFASHDVLLTPSTLGPAPLGLGNTGDPIFNRVWTLLGVPCITYPGGRSSGGLPLGIQVIGPVESDERLMATAKWMRENSGGPAEIRRS